MFSDHDKTNTFCHWRKFEISC